MNKISFPVYVDGKENPTHKMVRFDVFSMLHYMVILFVVCIALFICCVCFSQGDTNHKESYYQDRIIEKTGGRPEVVLDDGTRVDIMNDKEVIEVEFAHKWYESVGQSAHYGFKTGKQPVIFLIQISPKDVKYVERCQALCKNLKVWVKDKWVFIHVRIYYASTD